MSAPDRFLRFLDRGWTFALLSWFALVFFGMGMVAGAAMVLAWAP